MRLKELCDPAQGARQEKVIGIEKSKDLAGRSAKSLI
jgi:hypothetical protein